VTLRGASCHRAHVAVGSLACARRSAAGTEEGTIAGVAAMAEAAAAAGTAVAAVAATATDTEHCAGGCISRILVLRC